MDGVLVINKPKGMTSFDVVREVGRFLEERKVGHTGTLDPMAEGVLMICVGRATKIVELLTAQEKEYIAGVKLGIETDTYDTEGTILEEKEVPDNLPLEDVVSSFQKTYFQEVPIYSAVKVKGKKLYEYARNHQTVELPKKEVTIKEIKILSKEKESFTFQALVTKGCYIRSLIHDIGSSLGTGATMTSLIRTKQGNVSLDQAVTLEELKKGNYHLYSIEEVLDYPKIIVNEEQENRIRHGMFLDNLWDISDKVIFLSQEHQLLGIYERVENTLKVWKNFV